jgi:hypothetical protein
MELPSLLAGALLSKRGFRVLVLGQDAPAPSYELDGLTLPRAPWAFLGGHSATVKKTFSELALAPLLRRRLQEDSPPAQIVMPGHRFCLSPSPEVLEEEIAREFPSVSRPIADFHRDLASSMRLLDDLLSKGMAWPATGLLERRTLARSAVAHRFGPEGDAFDPLAALADDHPFRRAVAGPAAIASYLDPESIPALARMRLYAHWLASPAEIEGGLPWLVQALVERVRGAGGEVRPKERVSSILSRRGAVTGVELAGTGDTLGTSFVLCGRDVSQIAGRLADRARFERLFERLGEPRPRLLRYTLNLVLAAEGIPEGMGRHALVLSPGGALEGENLLHLQTSPCDAEGRRILTVMALLPRRQVEEESRYLEGVRERLLASLTAHFPFLPRHLLRLDSPHDGRPMQDLEHGREIPPSEPWLRGPHTLPVTHDFPVRGTLGLAAVPIKTPIARLLMVGHQSVPALGFEGDVLCAVAAARLVRKTDRQKEWMRRGLWTKVEI